MQNSQLCLAPSFDHSSGLDMHHISWGFHTIDYHNQHVCRFYIIKPYMKFIGNPQKRWFLQLKVGCKIIPKHRISGGRARSPLLLIEGAGRNRAAAVLMRGTEQNIDTSVCVSIYIFILGIIFL